MALVGTISGSNGTSNTAVTGTLVIANRATGFPTIMSDAVLFVSGEVAGLSKSVFGGDAVVSGNFVVGNDRIVTNTTTTFNLINTTLTGTLNIGGAARTVNFGSTISTGSFRGDLEIQGRTALGGIIEDMFHTQSAGGTLSFNTLSDSIFYVNAPTSNITANFTNVPTTAFKIITPTVILSQSATPRIVSSVTIDGGAAQTINWSAGVTPTGNANKQDVFGFSLIRSGSAWKVLGQMSSYG